MRGVIQQWKSTIGMSTVLFEAGLGRNQLRGRGLDGHLGRLTEDRVSEVG